MKYLELGRTGWNISTVSFGSWAFGRAGGRVDDLESLHALHRAADLPPIPESIMQQVSEIHGKFIREKAAHY